MTLTVSQLTNEIKVKLERDFSSVSVIGEISNFKPHNSGHWYFNLKDSGATICATMWRGFNNYVFFTPQDGMKIIVTGKLSVYPPRGNYQIDVRSMRPAGEGELQAAFEKLKQKLSAEGIFADENKKPIPYIPRTIGIVTAIDGAALKDMVSICKRRFPLVKLILAPSQVQGSGATDNIAQGIRLLNSRSDIDLIIVARGGGSIEDLWAFNEEKTARAIFNSAVPIITGIGHEIDFTIADFAADLRAPTPSAAMELATPAREEFYSFIRGFSFNAGETMNQLIKKSRRELKNIINSYGFRAPIDKLKRDRRQVKESLYRILNNTDKGIMLRKHKLAILTGRVESNDIQRTLKKGFVLVKQDGKFVTRSFDFDVTGQTTLRFYDNEINLKPNS